MRIPGYCLLLGACLVLVTCSKTEEKPANIIVSPNNFLASYPYNTLNIEIVSVSGYEPTATALNNLKDLLEARTKKSGGITITQRTIASPGRTTLTEEEFKSLESAHRTVTTSGSTITAFILFVDAEFASNTSNSKVLGVAYSYSSMVIFEKSIRQFSGGVGQPSAETLESAVVNHEFGHILGLVNRGTPMETHHEDAANPKHCNNQNCLMYYAAETSETIANLVGGNVPTLDANCLEDLLGNGGK